MLAIVNIERLHTKEFIVLNIYDNKSGYLKDQIIREFIDINQVIDILREVKPALVWTSNRDLYGILLQTIGISAEIKHPSDTSCTKRAVEQNADILKELFQIQPIKPLSKWRRWLCDVLTKLIKFIGGNKYGKY